LNKWIKKARSKSGETIKFLQELISLPSLSGKEQDVAKLIADKMRELRYDLVEIDDMGNVIGVIKGGSGPSLLYNGHMDTVPPGTMEDPYSGNIMDGTKFGVSGNVIYGRGTCDMKAALAAMIMSGGILKKAHVSLKGDLIVTAVVMEELAEAFGSYYLVTTDDIKPKVAVVGEATNLDLAIGHRGALYPEITVKGKSCHASAPERGVNALYKMTRIIKAVEQLTPDLPLHPFLGKVTMSINTIFVKPGVKNVVPESCSVSVDTRNTPDFTDTDVVNMLNAIIQSLKEDDPTLDAEVKLMEVVETSYTGITKKVKKLLPPFYTTPEDHYVKRAKTLISQVLGTEPKMKPWVFATDSSCFSRIGASTFGFGPGEERFAHSSDENVKIDDVIAALKVYTILPMYIC
jgi:putative selenium metabolism hydrolase